MLIEIWETGPRNSGSKRLTAGAGHRLVSGTGRGLFHREARRLARDHSNTPIGMANIATIVPSAPLERFATVPILSPAAPTNPQLSAANPEICSA
jgi:hypothetical protein